MEHLTDREMLDLLAAGGQADRPAAEHIGACADCRRRFEQYAATWRLLGKWQAPAARVDMGGRIVRVAEGDVRGRRRPPRLRQVGAWLARAAAIVLLGAGSFLAGRASRGGPQPPPPQAAQNVSDADAAHAIFLDSLGSDPVGLAESMRESLMGPQEAQQ